MARVKGSTPTRNRRKRILKQASGYFGSKHLLYKTAHEQIMHSWKYAYTHRKQLKREMRKLWISRINAAARLNGMTYSQLMHGLKLAGVTVNRKMLSEIAIHNPDDFAKICETAKNGKVENTSKAKKETKAEDKEDKPKKETAKKTTTKKASTTKKKDSDDKVETTTVKKATKKKKEEKEAA